MNECVNSRLIRNIVRAWQNVIKTNDKKFNFIKYKKTKLISSKRYQKDDIWNASKVNFRNGIFYFFTFFIYNASV